MRLKFATAFVDSYYGRIWSHCVHTKVSGCPGRRSWLRCDYFWRFDFLEFDSELCHKISKLCLSDCKGAHVYLVSTSRSHLGAFETAECRMRASTLGSHNKRDKVQLDAISAWIGAYYENFGNLSLIQDHRGPQWNLIMSNLKYPI